MWPQRNSLEVCWFCRNKYFAILIVLVNLGCATPLPPKKSKDILCPEVSTGEQNKPLDAMPISATEALLVCGHREDTRSAKRMRVSETEIHIYNIEKDMYSLVWSVGPLDVRYLQLMPKVKQFEVLWPVFDKDSKPTPVIRELYSCMSAGCELKEKKSVFNKENPAYISALPKTKNLAYWLQEEDSVARATTLFFAAAAGDRQSRKVIQDKSHRKLASDGYFEKTMVYYNFLLDELQKLDKK